MADDGGVQIRVESNIREVLARAKEFSPALARDLRRDLRQTGEGIIAAQRQVLSGPLPGNAIKTGQRAKWVTPKNGRKKYLRAVNTYEARAASRSRSRGMRERVKASLMTAVMTGARRSGVRIKARKAKGDAMVLTWNKKVFRHPVFSGRSGKRVFTSQYGQPYWWEPIKAGQAVAKEKAEQAINKALEEISRG